MYEDSRREVAERHAQVEELRNKVINYNVNTVVAIKNAVPFVAPKWAVIKGDCSASIRTGKQDMQTKETVRWGAAVQWVTVMPEHKLDFISSEEWEEQAKEE